MEKNDTSCLRINIFLDYLIMIFLKISGINIKILYNLLRRSYDK